MRLPFNYKKALDGAALVTRDGKEVAEFGPYNKFGKTPYPCYGVIAGKRMLFTKEGRFSMLYDSPNDLFIADAN